MLDLDESNFVHWMLINIPGTDLDAADTIAEYNSPTPKKGDKAHR